DAERLAQRVVDGDGVSDMRLAGLVQDRGGEEAEVRDRAGDVEGARQRQRLAAVFRFELRELVEVFFDQIGELQQQRRAVRRGGTRPRRKRALRRLHGVVDV